MAEPASAHVQMMQKRLHAAASQLETRYKDMPHMLNQVADAKLCVQEYIAAYDEGKPFFPRDMMASLDQQIDALRRRDAAETDDDGIVTLTDVTGRSGSWPLKPPGGCSEEMSVDTYIILYNTHQKMTHMSVKFPENMLGSNVPVQLGWTRAGTPSGWPLDDLADVFRTHQASWLASADCASLVDILAASATTPIRKIVCFGLGRLDDWEKRTREDLADSTKHAAVQHAAALTMAEVLGRAQGLPGALPCYAQDPAYAGVEKQLLAALGFVVLADPKGFLEVDADTLVLSVAPNVPVQQIVADMGWPAAMVWNTIAMDREDESHRDYELINDEHGELRCCPWSTDEGSTRVTEMARHYTCIPFPGDPSTNNFGQVSIYLRNKLPVNGSHLGLGKEPK
ncbi:Sensitivity To Red Light Reduced-SRR1 [Cordyceps militaris]|uniref:Sensitivity To Red Light Reduced-SRR1 n=1 Tax=Cordyceps militaris TaxID=73501 RepID=A0A2H4SFL4_CORMI|nr:Sensitivity To Red Light Reduced-SRR1 [Cordyceps militaris]